MKLVAKQEFTYASVPLKAGDAFDASDEDARILKGVGKARDVARVQTRQMASEGDSLFKPVTEASKGGKGRSARYNRADMRAED